MANIVLVENLPTNKTAQDLHKLLAKFGQIDWIFIEIDKETNRPWGYAYVAFASIEQSTFAVANSQENSLGMGNDQMALRLRSVEAGPHNYLDKAPLLTTLPDYIFSLSSLIIDSLPNHSTIILNGVDKSPLDAGTQVEITNLLPGEYSLEIRQAGKTIFSQNIEIISGQKTKQIVALNTYVAPLPGILAASKSQSFKWGIPLFLIGLIIVSILVWYYKSTPIPEVVHQPPPPTPPVGMAYILGQRFVMGRNSSKDPLGFEMPAHVTEVKRSFFLDKLEVTNRQYAEFVKATGYQPPAHWQGTIPPAEITDLPVVFVSWEDATNYCHWRNNGQPCRLPHEDEWELAARGSQGWLYPWGNDWRDIANANKINKGLMPVGSKPENASPFGVLDMVGNVWEWTDDDLIVYPLSKAPPQPNAKVIRGGAYDSDIETATGSFRGFVPPNSRKYDRTGFRCACDVLVKMGE